MRTPLLIASALLAPAPAPLAPPGLLILDESLSPEQALSLAFPQAERFEKRREILTDEGRLGRLGASLRTGRCARIFTWYEAWRGDELLGYLATADRIGKTQPITFAVAVDPDLEVHSLEVLAYRESHGGEVRRAAFRSQFVGKGPKSPLRVDRDIRNIAGATLSCHALTDGTHDLLAYLEELVGPGQAGPAQIAQRTLMNTRLEIELHAADEAAGRAALELAFAEVARLEGLLSAFRADSEVARINAAAGGEPVPVSPDTLEVLRRARDLARSTGGAFDPTAGALIRLWREATAADAPPAPRALEAALATVGWEELRLGRGAAQLTRPGARLDLGGVGKGYALERAAAVLSEAGIRAALLNFGGQVLATGPPPGASHWTVDLRDPQRPQELRCELALARGSVATTADYERGFELGGHGLSHVIDPRSGRPARGALAVTVLSERAAEADALSTALFVMGPERGLDYCEKHGTRAWFFGPGTENKSTALLESDVLPRAERRP